MCGQGLVGEDLSALTATCEYDADERTHPPWLLAHNVHVSKLTSAPEETKRSGPAAAAAAKESPGDAAAQSTATDLFAPRASETRQALLLESSVLTLFPERAKAGGCEAASLARYVASARLQMEAIVAMALVNKAYSPVKDAEAKKADVLAQVPALAGLTQHRPPAPPLPAPSPMRPLDPLPDSDEPCHAPVAVPCACSRAMRL